jgi:TRAP transporter TAXI family solute receptor
VGGVVALALASGCTVQTTEAPRQTIRISTGDPAGAYHTLGETLARVYTERLGGVQALAAPSPTLNLSLASLQDGAADLGFASARIAYAAYTGGTSRTRVFSKLRGIAVLYTGVFHIVVRRDSGLTGITDLRGKRVGMVLTSRDPRAGPARIDLVFNAYGVSMDELQVVRMTVGEVAEALETRRVDGVLAGTAFPYPTIADAATRVGIRFLEVDEAAVAKVRARAPFFKPVTIPRGTYPDQDRAVRAVGFDTMLLCREGLDEDTVYRLTKTFFDALPDLARIHENMRQVDPDRASATVIPLHAGAARYYRERQLLK